MVGGLAGVLLVALVAIGGWFAFDRWLGGGNAPDGTLQAIAAAPTAATSTEALAPGPLAPGATTEAVTPQATPGTDGPVPTATTYLSLTVATATLIPTPPPPTQAVPTAQPTRSPAASLVASTTPESSPQPGYPAPVLSSPEHNASLQEKATFGWQYGGPPLGAGQAFDLRVWSKQHESGIGRDQRRGALAPTDQSEAEIELASVPAIQQYGPGVYYWTVVVVQVPACYPTCSLTVIGEWGEEREFSYVPPGQPPTQAQPTETTAPPREPGGEGG
jgi:hypothetical protein